MKTTYATLSLLLVCGANFVLASPSLPRLLSHGAVPVGLEQSCFGTSIQFSSTGAAAPLDATQKVALPVGASKVDFKFAEPAQFRAVSFNNKGGAGLVDLYVSLDGKKWVKSASRQFKSSDSEVKIDRLGLYGSHLRFDFQTSNQGEIGVPHLTSAFSDSDYVVTQNDSAGSVVNFASGLGGARIIYSSSEALGVNGSVSTQAEKLAFNTKNQKKHYVVFDLQTERSISDVACLSVDGLESVVVYGGSKLSESEDWKGRLSLPLDAFAGLKTLAAANGKGEFKFKTGSVQRMRYVALELSADKSSTLMVLNSLQINGIGKVERRAKTKLETGVLVAAVLGKDGLEAAGIDAVDAAYKPLPAVFAWDLERNLSGNLLSGSRMSSGYGAAFQAPISTRSRRADDGGDPDPDPPGIEILRCDFVSEN